MHWPIFPRKDIESDREGCFKRFLQLGGLCTASLQHANAPSWKAYGQRGGGTQRAAETCLHDKSNYIIHTTATDACFGGCPFVAV